MSNPYSTPSADSFDSSPSQYGPGLVNQVRVYAILSIVQGALELLMGLFYIGVGMIFPQLIALSAKQQQDGGGFNGDGMNEEHMATFMLVVYASLGVATMIAGGLHIFAGIRNYNFRSRVLGFIALGGGLLALPTCYCSFTAIALGVYGLIVLINPQVAMAFQMRERGESVDTILAKFSPYQQAPQQPYPPH
jgi:hypothetical protein